MHILPHPTYFLNPLLVGERKKALTEFDAIRKSNPGSFSNLYVFWYRQTRIPAVRAALDEYFKAVIAGDR
ncbi:MAG: hypothetical protein AB1445_08795 [Bacillota bacterium]